ncbi:hypothetical protein AO262_01625, partial [Pseudomonas fluorescens ABAC62]
AATRHPWRGAAKPASLPVYPPNPCRIPASVFNGAPKIKITIKSQINSVDQQTADFVSEKDVRAGQKQSGVWENALATLWR